MFLIGHLTRYLIITFTANYFLIQAGEVDDILLLPGIGNQLYLATGLVDFPLVLISTEEGIQYNVTITSDNTQVLLNPDFIPFPSGIISTTPESKAINQTLQFLHYYGPGSLMFVACILYC